MRIRPTLLLQSDLTRYAKGLKKAGIAEFGIRVNHATGDHTIIVGKVAADLTGPDPDELLK